MDSAAVKEVVRRANEARDKASAWWNYYDDLTRVFWPSMRGFVTTRPEGTDANDDLFDGLPQQAARNFANTLVDLLWPDDGTDIRIRATSESLNENHNARLWLDDSSSRLRTALYHPKARMGQCNSAVSMSLSVLGIGPFFLGERNNRDGLLFHPLNPQNIAIEWGDSGPLAAYRFRHMTAKQAAAMFGEEALSEQVRKRKDDNKKDVYIHAVTQRKQAPGKLAKNMPWASVWIDRDANHVVVESGYLDFPYIVPRMGSVPENDNGQSPAMIAIPDANTLQEMGRSILIAGQMAATPPLFAPNDGSFVEANTFPGGISYYDVGTASLMRGNPVFPLDTGHSLPISRDMQRDVREQVRNAFFYDVLNLPEGQDRRTATEVIKRSEELHRIIGPEIKRLESDWKAPTIERAFNIMLNAGAFLPIPPELLGADVHFEYESPIKRMKQMTEIELAHILRDEFITLANINPQALDYFNTDQYMQYISSSLRTPARLLNPSDWVEQKRAIAAQQQQQMMELQAAQQAASVAKDAAPAVKEIQGMM